MEQFKRAKVVMLSHSNIDTSLTLYKTASGKPLHLSTNLDILSHHTNQHIHIISDDEIILFDWIYNNKENIVEQITSKTELIFVLEENKENQTFKKIIATTDTSLRVPYNNGDMNDLIILPQPSQQFIEQYIESYNKGEIITDVLVEYESKFETIQEGLPGFPEDNISWWNNKIKVNPKDNTITIKKLKDSWNREEVISIIRCFDRGINKPITNVSKWIEENL